MTVEFSNILNYNPAPKPLEIVAVPDTLVKVPYKFSYYTRGATGGGPVHGAPAPTPADLTDTRKVWIGLVLAALMSCKRLTSNIEFIARNITPKESMPGLYSIDVTFVPDDKIKKLDSNATGNTNKAEDGADFDAKADTDAVIATLGVPDADGTLYKVFEKIVEVYANFTPKTVLYYAKELKLKEDLEEQVGGNLPIYFFVKADEILKILGEANPTKPVVKDFELRSQQHKSHYFHYTPFAVLGSRVGVAGTGAPELAFIDVGAVNRWKHRKHTDGLQSDAGTLEAIFAENSIGPADTQQCIMGFVRLDN